MKIIFFLIGGLVLAGGIYLLTQKKATTVSDNSGTNGGNTIIDKILNKNKNTEDKNTGTTPVVIPVVKPEIPPVVTPDIPPVVTPEDELTEKMELGFEGQPIWAKLNGVGVGANAIGYLADKTILYFSVAEYRDGEYKRIISDPRYNASGVDITTLLGTYPIANILGTFDRSVYGLHKTKVIDVVKYPDVIGFTDDAYLVNKQVMSLGAYGTYNYYHIIA